MSWRGRPLSKDARSRARAKPASRGTRDLTSARTSCPPARARPWRVGQDARGIVPCRPRRPRPRADAAFAAWRPQRPQCRYCPAAAAWRAARRARPRHPVCSSYIWYPAALRQPAPARAPTGAVRRALLGGAARQGRARSRRGLLPAPQRVPPYHPVDALRARLHPLAASRWPLGRVWRRPCLTAGADPAGRRLAPVAGPALLPDRPAAPVHADHVRLAAGAGAGGGLRAQVTDPFLLSEALLGLAAWNVSPAAVTVVRGNLTGRRVEPAAHDLRRWPVASRWPGPFDSRPAPCYPLPTR